MWDGDVGSVVRLIMRDTKRGVTFGTAKSGPCLSNFCCSLMWGMMILEEFFLGGVVVVLGGDDICSGWGRDLAVEDVRISYDPWCTLTIWN